MLTGVLIYTGVKVGLAALQPTTIHIDKVEKRIPYKNSLFLCLLKTLPNGRVSLNSPTTLGEKRKFSRRLLKYI